MNDKNQSKTSMQEEEYLQLSDTELIALAKQDDARAVECLLNRYKNFVRVRTRPYFLIGADRDDLVQEGMIGLFKAIRDYDIEKQASFRSFAELCITRQMITAIKSATRQKHQPLNSYISLNRPIFDEESSERSLLDFLTGTNWENPESIVIDKEALAALEGKIGEMMSDLEKRVLVLFLQGKSYQEIAEKLNRSPKSVDNALQRVKMKLEKYMKEGKI